MLGSLAQHNNLLSARAFSADYLVGASNTHTNRITDMPRAEGRMDPYPAPWANDVVESPGDRGEASVLLEKLLSTLKNVFETLSSLRQSVPGERSTNALSSSVTVKPVIPASTGPGNDPSDVPETVTEAVSPDEDELDPFDELIPVDGTPSEEAVKPLEYALDPFDDFMRPLGPHRGAGISLIDYERKRIGSRAVEFDVADLPLSNKPKGEKPSDMKHGLVAIHIPFPWLGKDKRTPYVEVIKMAMEKFGQSAESVFDEVTATATGYNVTMKDGFKLHITNQELRLARKASRFGGADEGMLGDAYFMFGVMCKRQQINQNDYAAGVQAREAEFEKQYPNIPVYSRITSLDYLGVLRKSYGLDKPRDRLVGLLGLGGHMTEEEIKAGKYEPYVHQHAGAGMNARGEAVEVAPYSGLGLSIDDKARLNA
ncbi:hypothetical protein [Pseudomonas sp. SDO5271_S396]